MRNHTTQDHQPKPGLMSRIMFYQAPMSSDDKETKRQRKDFTKVRRSAPPKPPTDKEGGGKRGRGPTSGSSAGGTSGEPPGSGATEGSNSGVGDETSSKTQSGGASATGDGPKGAERGIDFPLMEECEMPTYREHVKVRWPEFAVGPGYPRSLWKSRLLSLLFGNARQVAHNWLLQNTTSTYEEFKTFIQNALERITDLSEGQRFKNASMMPDKTRISMILLYDAEIALKALTYENILGNRATPSVQVVEGREGQGLSVASDPSA